MNQEFMEALDMLEKERGISKDILIDALEAALTTAYKRNCESAGNVRAEVNRDTGEVKMFALKSVVERVENPYTEISLENAKKINVLYGLGDVLEEEVRSRSFSRIAAQTAKQVIVQRIRETERGMILDEYREKENEVLTAIVQRIERNGVYVELGKTDGFLDNREIPQGEMYEPNQRLKVYVLEVRSTSKGPQVEVSRTHPGLVKRLFELEVPEIQDGLINIRAVARIPGERAKIAVESYDDRIDPVGACVGIKGSRIHGIVRELHNENIDVIPYTSNDSLFIQRALSPAKVSSIRLDPEEKKAEVFLRPEEVSLAIGKNGLNIKLASILTGYTIDVYRDTDDASADDEDIYLDEFKDEIEEWVVEALKKAGFVTAKSVLNAPRDMLVEKADLEEETVDNVLEILRAEFED